MSYERHHFNDGFYTQAGSQRIARCSECGVEFQQVGTWQRLCKSCYVKTKERDVADEARAAGYAAGLRDGLNRNKGATLDADTLRKIVTLTHPDRHPPERAELANRVTAALLALMKASK